MKKKNNNKRTKKSRSQNSERLVAIPSIVSTPEVTQTFRFAAADAADNLIISRGDVLNLLQLAVVTGGVGTGQGARIIRALKINSIEIFVPPLEAASLQQLNFTWQSQFGAPKTYTITSVGTAILGHQKLRPPPMSGASFWSISGVNESEPLFTMDVPMSTIIDLHCSWVMQNIVSTSVTPVITGTTHSVTEGSIYVAALDGVSTNELAPGGWLWF